jgi:hypothetical protein
MVSDPDRRRSRQLVLLALMAASLATLWSVRTPPDPNSDRYDYLGRAHHVIEGAGPRPLVIYPLRTAFGSSASLPAENLTRAPLWPHLLAPALRLGASEYSGVVVATLGLFTLLPLMMFAGDRAFGAGAGGFAALALSASFATVRAIWGGGPEIWLALLLYTAWTWHATGRAGALGLGAILGTLPWLHPIGWLYAGLGLCSRVGRTAPRALMLAALVTVAVGSPWYAFVGSITGTPFTPLQGSAELAKAVLDPGGLGPYRGLEPVSALEVVTQDPKRWAHQWGSNLKHLALHLDAWIAWPLVALALLGIGRDRALAGRDAMLGVLAFAVVSQVARDPRLLVPLLPIACTWAGAGFVSVTGRIPRWIGPGAAAVLAALPWALPLGAAVRPGTELADMPLEWRDPPREIVRAVGAVGSPVFVDSGVLAWRARSLGVFLPDAPETLERIRALPALRDASHLILARGTASPWLASAPEAWAAWLARRGAVDESTLVVPLDPPSTEPRATERVYVPELLALGPDDRPDDLVELDVPPANRSGLRLRSEAARALSRLVAAARDDGIELRVVSAYRSHARQAELHASALRQHGPDQRWVAAPGASEHQLGTTVDFADAALRHVLEPSFASTEEGRWLAAHAARFGFVRSFTEENESLTGYRPEPWHYRHRPELFDEIEGREP